MKREENGKVVGILLASFEMGTEKRDKMKTRCWMKKVHRQRSRTRDEKWPQGASRRARAGEE